MQIKRNMDAHILNVLGGVAILYLQQLEKLILQHDNARPYSAAGSFVTHNLSFFHGQLGLLSFHPFYLYEYDRPKIRLTFLLKSELASPKI